MPKFHFDRNSLPPPPAAAIDYLIKSAADSDLSGVSHTRRIGLLAAVLPVDARFKPVGEAFLGLVKNVTAVRITLLHTRAISYGSAVIEVGTYPLSRLQLFCKVTRCEPASRFYEIEAVIVSRIQE